MNQDSYPITVQEKIRYTFISEGINGYIIKAVIFQEMGEGIYNLALLDYIPNENKWDDKSNSNNGDLPKIMRTVLVVILQFFEKNPNKIIYIEGNTEIRKKLYDRIIKNYYQDFSNQVGILVDTGLGLQQPFLDKTLNSFYLYKK